MRIKVKGPKNEIRVHRNLHRAKVGGPQWVLTKKGRVTDYVDSITLTQVTTRIQGAGQRKCRQSQVRSVCGFLDGQRDSVRRTGTGWERIGFDPRVDESFVANGKAWNSAQAVALKADGSAWVLEPKWVER